MFTAISAETLLSYILPQRAGEHRTGSKPSRALLHKGRSALKEWIEYRKANTDTHVWAAFSGAYYLAFDHLDLYIEAIDSYGPPSTYWSDVEVLETFGVYVPVTGYRMTQHYLDRAAASSLMDLWENRGPPDHCTKDSGEWVCE